MLTSYWKQTLCLKHVKVYPEDFFFSLFSSSFCFVLFVCFFFFFFFFFFFLFLFFFIYFFFFFFFFFFFNLLSQFYLKGIM
jgi:hypothetical protein